MVEPLAPRENESLIRIEGLLSPEDQRWVVDTIGRLGVHASYLENRPGKVADPGNLIAPASQIDIICQHGYLFSDITKPDDIIVREHFENLGSTDPLRVRNFVRAFHKLLDQRGIGRLFTVVPREDKGGYRHQQTREPVPMGDIVVAKRSELGLKPYKGNYTIADLDARILSQYGMTAGSVDKTISWMLDQNPERMVQTTKRALFKVATRLHGQIQS